MLAKFEFRLVINLSENDPEKFEKISFVYKQKPPFSLTLPLLHKARTMTRGTLNILLVLVHALRGGYGVWSCRTV